MQISMFRARHKGDFKTLRSLHTNFVGSMNYPAGLMCLDSAFASTLPLQGAPAVNPRPELLIHFSYFELLDRLRREDSLDTGSIRQKIFAFQPHQDDQFFVPANTFLHTIFLSKPDTVQEKGGCVVTHEELRRVLDYEIPEYMRLRAKQQNNAYRRRLGAAPCLAAVTGGGCPKQDCQLQHIRPEKMTVGWFNDRIRLVLLEIQILNLAGFHPLGAIQCVLRWPVAETTPASDPVGIGIGSVFFTLACIPRCQSLDPSQHWILGTHRNRPKDSGFCKSGSGKRVTNSPLVYGNGTTNTSSPILCLSVRWHTTSTSSGRRCMSLTPGCVAMGSGRSVLFGQGSEWRNTSSSGISLPSYRVVHTIH